MKDTLNLAFVSSKEYVPFLTVMLESIKANNRDSNLEFYILQNGFGEREKGLLAGVFAGEDNATFHYVPIDMERIGAVFGNSYAKYTAETCAKLFISWLIPEELDRILYLDIDMVVNASLRGLYEMDFEGKLLICCKEITAEYVPNRFAEVKSLLARFGPSYFNTGILLLSPREIRAQISMTDFTAAAEALEHKLPFVEQDIHNYVYRGKCKFVDPFLYNFHFIEYAFEVFGEKTAYEYAKAHSVVVHYLQKPWATGDVFFRQIYRLWWEYAAKTEFFTGWLLDMFTAMGGQLAQKRFDIKYFNVRDSAGGVTGALRRFFEARGCRSIGVYGIGVYGRLFMEHAPEGFSYTLFDRAVREHDGQPVFPPADIPAHTGLDLMVLTPANFEQLRYDLAKLTDAPVVTFDHIINQPYFYNL
ncbi:MAG: glycosyltransferase family 8 protein [Oscillospiraceae bacterium]